MPLGKKALTTALGCGLLLVSTHVLAAGIVVEERVLAPQVATQALPRADAEPLHSQPLDGSDDKSDSNSGTTWEMYQQLQQLQQEVARLRGTVEEQGHLLERMRNDQKAQYTDLDLRINGLGEKLTAAQAVAAPTASPAAEVPAGPAAVANIEEERKAYLAAYKVFTDQGPDKAIAPMQAFVTRYPDSTFAPNAHYWLGEFYLAASKPDLENARKQFETVLNRFSSHAKAPGSLYKLGTIAELQNKPEQARKHMQDLLSRYPGSSEATLATNFLKQQAKPAPAKK